MSKKSKPAKKRAAKAASSPAAIIPITPSKTNSRADNEAAHFAQQHGGTEEKAKPAQKKEYPYAPPKTAKKSKAVAVKATPPGKEIAANVA